MKPSNWIEQLNQTLWLHGKTSSLHDPARFARLYEDTHLPVFRYIYGLTGGPTVEVEDLTAETFLRAWKNRLTYQGRAEDATGWLIRIARNLVIDEYRRSGTRPALLDDAVDDDLPQPDSLNPETCSLLNEQQQILLDLLQNLPPDVREMLVLRYLLDWKVNRIAEHLELPQNTVSVTIRRALEKIQQAWPSESEI